MIENARKLADPEVIVDREELWWLLEFWNDRREPEGPFQMSRSPIEYRQCDWCGAYVSPLDLQRHKQDRCWPRPKVSL
jgi:hypothetical protein